MNVPGGKSSLIFKCSLPARYRYVVETPVDQVAVDPCVDSATVVGDNFAHKGVPPWHVAASG